MTYDGDDAGLGPRLCALLELEEEGEAGVVLRGVVDVVDGEDEGAVVLGAKGDRDLLHFGQRAFNLGGRWQRWRSGVSDTTRSTSSLANGKSAR